MQRHHRRPGNDVGGAVVTRAAGAPPLPPSSLVAILVAGRAGPTWDRSVQALQNWQQFAAPPAKPAEFLHFLATRVEVDAGSAQMKMRICAIDAASQQVGVASPSGDATVCGRPPGKARRPRPGTPNVPRRDSCARSCRRSPPRTRASTDGSRARGSPAGSARARAAAGRHLMPLSDATARCDDLNEGLLGDVLFEDVRTATPFWVPSARAAAQVSPPPCLRPLSAALFVNSVRRYGAAACGRSGCTGGPRRRVHRRRAGPHPPGPTAVAMWPVEVQALVPRLYGVGIPALGLPIFRAVTVARCPAVPTADRRPLYARLPAPATRTIRTVGRDAINLGRTEVRRRRSSTPACRAPSSRRRCGTPPRRRTSCASLKPPMFQGSLAMYGTRWSTCLPCYVRVVHP